MSGKGRILLLGSLLAAATLFYVYWPRNGLPHGAVVQKITCVNNLKQIGLAFRTWAIDHDGLYPFNIRTNAGGTLELCAMGNDGFDNNAAMHFRVMSDELATPRILICPQDHKKKPALSFSTLHEANLTYQLRTGTNITERSGTQTIVLCPIDGNALRCDGSVVDGKGHVVPPFLLHTNE